MNKNEIKIYCIPKTLKLSLKETALQMFLNFIFPIFGMLNFLPCLTSIFHALLAAPRPTVRSH